MRSCRARPAAWSAWSRPARRTAHDRADRLRHGRHLDRRVALRRPASSWATRTSSPGVRIRAPMMQIHTVAAGGGSICRFDGMRFRVGPESAGARPGPACYRDGGPLTVTDCNLFLGRISADHFPAVFGPDGDQPLDPDGVARAARRRSPTRSSGDGKRLRSTRSPRGSSTSRSTIWPPRSARSRSRAAMTSRATRSPASAARAASMPAASPTRWAWSAS